MQLLGATVLFALRAPGARALRPRPIIAAAVLFALVGATIALRWAAPVCFESDFAVTALYARRAAEGSLLLGPYSRFGWHHPGPAIFYLFAPFYAVSGWHASAIRLAAFAINVACLWIIASAWMRRSDFAGLAVGVALLGLLVGRAPELIVSPWGAHLPVLPLGALVLLCAEAMSGDVGRAPLAALVASCVAQTHVAVAPVAGLLLGVTVATLALRARKGRPDGDATPLRPLLLAGGILALLWAPVVAEQIVSDEGNLTRLARTFLASRGGTHGDRTMFTAIEVTGRGLVFTLLPDFELAWGNETIRASPGGGGPAWALLLASLAHATVSASRRRHRFRAAQAALLCLSIIVATILVWLDPEPDVSTHVVFWIAIIGVLSIASSVEWLVEVVARSMTPKVELPTWPRVRRVLCFGVLGFVTAVGAAAGAGVHIAQSRSTTCESIGRVRRAVRDVSAGSVYVDLDHDAWGDAAAVALALDNDGVRVLFPESWLVMFGPWARSDARADLNLYLTDRWNADAANVPGSRRRVATLGHSAVWVVRDLHTRGVPPAGVLPAPTMAPGVADRIADGSHPAAGTRWDVPECVIFPDTEASVDVWPPPGEMVGLRLWADNNDAWEITCQGAPSQRIFTSSAVPGVGIRPREIYFETGLLCDSVRLRPARGDGSYSLCEVEFLVADAEAQP